MMPKQTQIPKANPAVVPVEGPVNNRSENMRDGSDALRKAQSGGAGRQRGLAHSSQKSRRDAAPEKAGGLADASPKARRDAALENESALADASAKDRTDAAANTQGNRDGGAGASPYGENNEQLPMRLQEALRRLVFEYSTESEQSRRQEIRRIKQAHQFWRGLQYLWWTSATRTGTCRSSKS
jgi:hypothetical protein